MTKYIVVEVIDGRPIVREIDYQTGTTPRGIFLNIPIDKEQDVSIVLSEAYIEDAATKLMIGK